MTGWSGDPTPAARETRGAPAAPGAASAATAASPEPDVERQDAVRALLHDLRQPLAAIRVLADGDGDPRLGAIQREAQWMSDLVEQVLGATRGHAPVLCDLRGVAADSLSRAALAATCELTLAPGGPGAAVVDPRSITRALGCLLDNAVRAAGPGGHVTVSVRIAGDDVLLAVADDGPGPGRIGPQHNLGLTITRALLAPYGGALTLRAGVSGGAVATVRLPSAATARAVAS